MNTVTMNKIISTKSEQAQLLVRHGIRVQEDDLDVEDDERASRSEKYLIGKRFGPQATARRLDAALIEVETSLRL